MRISAPKVGWSLEKKYRHSDRGVGARKKPRDAKGAVVMTRTWFRKRRFLSRLGELHGYKIINKGQTKNPQSDGGA